MELEKRARLLIDYMRELNELMKSETIHDYAFMESQEKIVTAMREVEKILVIEIPPPSK